MTPDTYVQIGIFALGTAGLLLRDRSGAKKDAAHQALIEAKVEQIESAVPSQIDAALAKFSVSFVKELNGNYMRTPLIQAHIDRLADKSDSIQRELTDLKTEVRNALERK